MTGLTSLNLGSNVIDELDADAFRDLSALQFLYLNAYLLPSSPSLRLCAMILSSSADGSSTALRNQLASLPANVFASLTSLRELELVGNVLSSLRVDSFRFQTALTKLLLTDNRLAQNDLSQSLFLNISTAAAVAFRAARALQCPALTCVGLLGDDHRTGRRSCGHGKQLLYSGLCTRYVLSGSHAAFGACLRARETTRGAGRPPPACAVCTARPDMECCQCIPATLEHTGSLNPPAWSAPPIAVPIFCAMCGTDMPLLLPATKW